jgi:glycosyltransferase involved in cell wall biosynthesis
MHYTGLPLSLAPQVIVHVQTRMLTGGAEENTWASCEHQIGQGHEVHLVCGRDSKVDFYRAKNARIGLHLIPELCREISPARDVRAYLRIRDLLKKLRPNIVHTHTSKAGIVGRLAADAAHVPVILHGVHMLPFSNVGLAHRVVYLMAEHAAAALTDRYIHVSEGTRRAYRNAKIGRDKPHAVVRSGMEITRFRTKDLPEDWQDLLGMSQHSSSRPRMLLMLAALEARKRHEEFIRAFLHELGDRQDVVLLLAGDGPERQNLVNLVTSLDAAQHVRLLGHRDDPHKLIQLADATALSSLREGLPRVVVQSLAGGRPAVVSPIEGIEEILSHGENGIIAPDPSAASVAREAVRLVRNGDRLAALQCGAAKAKVEAWTFAAMFRQLDQSYRLALQMPSSEKRSRERGKPRGDSPRELAANKTGL